MSRYAGLGDSQIDDRYVRFNNFGDEETYVTLRITGTDAAAFSVNSDSINVQKAAFNSDGSVDHPGYAGTYLRFSPTEERSYSATLEVNSPVLSEPFTVDLSGVGSLSNAISWAEEQQTVFTNGGLGKTMMLPLKLVNSTGQTVAIEIEHDAVFESVNFRGGVPGNTDYTLDIEGSRESDYISAIVNQSGAFEGDICLVYGEHRECKTFSGNINGEVEFFPHTLYRKCHSARVLFPVKPVPSGSL